MEDAEEMQSPGCRAQIRRNDQFPGAMMHVDDDHLRLATFAIACLEHFLIRPTLAKVTTNRLWSSLA
jgi:hypothetical protein